MLRVSIYRDMYKCNIYLPRSIVVSCDRSKCHSMTEIKVMKTVLVLKSNAPKKQIHPFRSSFDLPMRNLCYPRI